MRVPIPVYDLTVETHSCYRANGILVSNSDAFRTFATSVRTPILTPDDHYSSPVVSYSPDAWMS